ncbi:Efr3p [Saccharomyces eubayanus]|uniref:Efr3p n=1 Tax=Saccharomyces eubayanus TaxID=1080349 RepID=UPI0006C12824|nr:EFR3-like protein [Saccharomyces eubayanus]KOG97542.1 EFR3-like protein [Saccharomyces eubayanus]
MQLSMRMMFTPKHQKLVNQCYPTGRTTDKKPKSSETSYLLYYVNSRRSKLEKVSTYLIKRSTSDLNHRRIGNIAVTLDLMNKIVLHCRENLNVFVKDFLYIMNKVLSNNNFNNDVAVVELVELAFSSICLNLDDVLCNGDMEFIQLYQSFVDLFFKIVTERIHNDDMLLKCCIDISNTNSVSSNPQLNHFVSKSVTYTISKFQERNPKFKTLSLGPVLDGNLGNLGKRLSRTQTRTVGLDKTVDDNNDISIRALQSYFNTTETDKLNLSIRTLLRCLQNTPNKELLEFICNGIPVQLRYIVILLLVRQLSDKDKNVDPVVSLKLMSSLLVSDVSIVGLSVLDIMRKLLNFQLKNVADKEVVEQSCITMTDLNHKTYYTEQTSDMLYELLLKLKSDTTKDLERNAVVEDVDYLVEHITQPSISLELFIDLAHYMRNQIISLFAIVETEVPTGFVFSKLYSLLRELDSHGVQKEMMEEIFDKYGKVALLSGLHYFLENVSEPEYTYYSYHLQAAEFLKLNDYKSQTEYKMQTKTLFTKEDLLSYYSDMGSNKYTNRGAQILMSRDNQISTSDLLSDFQVRTTSPDYRTVPNVVLPNGNSMPNNKDVTIKQSRFDKSIDDKVDEGNDTVISDANAKGSIYRFVAEDARSWKTMRATAPKISDLKKAINERKNPNDMKRDGSVRCSQSVKSRVTNITFLLSELKNFSEDANNVKDPDEENIVGLDKIDVARSNSLRLAPISSISDRSSIGNRRSLIQKTPVVEDQDDDFKDANEDLHSLSSRGKIFSST